MFRFVTIDSYDLTLQHRSTIFVPPSAVSRPFVSVRLASPLNAISIKSVKPRKHADATHHTPGETYTENLASASRSKNTLDLKKVSSLK